jgi:hypothetical protein
MERLASHRPSPKPNHRVPPDPGPDWWRDVELLYYRHQVRRLTRERAQAEPARKASPPASAR